MPEVTITYQGLSLRVSGEVSPGSRDPRRINPPEDAAFLDPAVFLDLPDETGSLIPVDVSGLLAALPTGRGLSHLEEILEVADAGLAAGLVRENLATAFDRARDDAKYEDYFRWAEDARHEQ